MQSSGQLHRKGFQPILAKSPCRSLLEVLTEMFPTKIFLGLHKASSAESTQTSTKNNTSLESTSTITPKKQPKHLVLIFEQYARRMIRYSVATNTAVLFTLSYSYSKNPVNHEPTSFSPPLIRNNSSCCMNTPVPVQLKANAGGKPVQQEERKRPV